MNEIEVQYPMMADNVIAGYRLSWRLSVQRKIRIAILVVLALLVGLYALDPVSGEPGGGLWLMALAALVLLATSRPARESWTRYRFSKRPDAGAEITVTLDGDGIRIVAADLAKSEAKWASVYRAVLAGDGILLFPSERIFHWLPRTGFTSDADYSAARDLISAKVAKTRVVS